MPLQAQESKTAQPVPPTPKSAPAPAQPTEPRSNPLPEKLDKVNQDSPAEPATEKSALPAKVEPVPQPKEMSPAPSPGPGETPGKSEPMRDGRGSPKSQPKVPVPSLTEPGSKESQLPTDKMTAVLDPSMKPEKKGETTR